jgi:hypothetical protein
MRSGCASGAGVIACADVATAKANPAAAIILIISLPLLLRKHSEYLPKAATPAWSGSKTCGFV